MAWIVLVLLLLVAIHAFMSLRYNYDWIGANVRKFIVPSTPESVVDMFPIPSIPYLDRFGSYTRIPKMKENVR